MLVQKTEVKNQQIPKIYLPLILCSTTKQIFPPLENSPQTQFYWDSVLVKTDIILGEQLRHRLPAAPWRI